MRRDKEFRGARRVLGLLLAAVLVTLPSIVSGQTLAEKMKKGPTWEQASKFNLAAGPVLRLTGNQFECGLTNSGGVCTDVTNNPNLGGGFWPRGTPDQYMYRSGLQVMGIIPANAGFDWAGDTVGALFNEGTGSLLHGTELSQVYNSLNPADLANWPGPGTFPDFPEVSAFLCDTSIYNAVLVSQDCGGLSPNPVAAASQQDSWVLYWDGDPSKINGRDHPMGILVEQRSLAWNYPVGNESIIYFIYRFTNVTNNARFQALNEARFFGGANALPDAGWRIDSIYVASDSDPDVTSEAGSNFSTALLPWQMGIAYDGDFADTDFDYPAAYFLPPFMTDAPGIIGIKYLKSPVDPATGEEVGMTSFSLHTNPSAANSFFPDPGTVEAAWRYVSLNVDASLGDPSCTFDLEEVRERRSCALAQVPTDVRFFVGSGPFSLNPGETATIAVAMLVAPTVDTDALVNGSLNPPGFPTTAPGCFGQPIRPIEVGAGYISPRDCPAAGEPLDQFETNVVPNSLLGKALVAQAVFDSKFLLGFAPDAPPFYLVPGDERVTIVWEPSATEEIGDPYIAATGDTASLLYDPNYREFDVEGYRIYRGTSPSDMRMIAQYDKSGTVFTDYRCVLDATHITGQPCGEVHEYDIVSPFVQYINTVELASGVARPIESDTALAAAIRNDPPLAMDLTNTGIPFSHVDTVDIRNGFTYYYRVTAFDINSVLSGPSSLESTAETRFTTPRPLSATLTPAEFTSQVQTIRGPLPTIPAPTINATTGTFSGPAQPATETLSGEVVLHSASLLAPGTYMMRLDSITPFSYVNSTSNGVMWFTGPDGTIASVSVPDAVSGSQDADEATLDVGPLGIPANAAIRDSLLAAGLDSVSAPTSAGSMTGTVHVELQHWASAMSDFVYLNPAFWHTVPPNTQAGGSRWFAGANETVADPTAGVYDAGELPGVTEIFRPTSCSSGGACPAGYPTLTAYSGISQALFRRWHQSTFSLTRAADMKFYWGATGLDSVIDVTHNVPVPFSPAVRASYGFLQDGNADGVLNWGDMTHISGTEVFPNISRSPKANLTQQPNVLPVDVTGDLAGDGAGFALYVAGEVYYFQAAAPPTNTVWTLRTYNGAVSGGPGAYAFEATLGNPVPGLAFAVTVTAGAGVNNALADLSRVHTVPDPFYAVSRFDLGPSNKELHFVNLPTRATIRIYSLSGVLVDVINHEDIGGGTLARWDLRNRSGQFVASGVYLFHVSTPDGKSHVGKFTVVNSGFANR